MAAILIFSRVPGSGRFGPGGGVATEVKVPTPNGIQCHNYAAQDSNL